MMRNSKPETFILSTELMDACDVKETMATFKAMGELGIHKPPYEHFLLMINADRLFITGPKNKNWETWLKNKTESGSELCEVAEIDVMCDLKDPNSAAKPTLQVFLHRDRRRINLFDLFPRMAKEKALSGAEVEEFANQIKAHASFWVIALVVLLSTKYVRKTREVNKLAKLGIGKHKNASIYRTTLSLARVDEPDEKEASTPTGLHRRPHLRRGHVRNQKWGPKNQFTKKVFIEPIFVNSDREFVSVRDYYNVIKGPKAD